MRKYVRYFLITSILSFTGWLKAQVNDSLKNIQLNEVIVIANRIPIVQRLNPSSTSLVLSDNLKSMPRSIAADEALRLVPGVRIDNQANGSRLHMSIRGQGILSERGLRGIKVLIDGITVNDPSGFAPDLYDVDWININKIEVLKGPAASLYGGGSAAGIINITTNEENTKPLSGKIYLSGGSNSFIKAHADINGNTDRTGYFVSFSKMKGDGYRAHTAFWANNFYEKITLNSSDHLKIKQILSYTEYFNQNAEGLNIEQVKQNPKQANPDAIPFNEYQKTRRLTNGLIGQFDINKHHNIQVTSFFKLAYYKETSNKAAQYRNFITPGLSAQYNWLKNRGNIKNHFAFGTDIQWQTINEYKFKSLSNPNRVDKADEINLEDTIPLANQVINQHAYGLFVTNELELMNKLSLLVNLRYDEMHNELSDKLNQLYSSSGKKDFGNVTGRIGIAYNVNKIISLYTNWGMGFLPPATEELASNPDAWSGFNQHLKPATSMGYDLGMRGSLNERIYYDFTGFYMTTKDDFYRFKLYPARGNQEVFYGNMGTTNRYGIETYMSFNINKNLDLQVAYTYNHFTYTKPDSISGNYIPNSPDHELFAELEYSFLNHFKAVISSELQTHWYIFTDAANYPIKQDGFNLYHASLIYSFSLFGKSFEAGLYVKNIANTSYIAFTEPDPDKNAYQPGVEREFFGTFKIIL